MEALTRGEVAQQGRVNPETIRYYERRGLLPKPPRTPSGYRAFSSDAVRRVRFIKRAQGLGFSLKEIKALLTLRIDPRRSCGDVRTRAEAKVEEIEAKVRMLLGMKKALVRLTAACAGRGRVSQCPILESLDAEEES
jgi:MerR family mercuric resistance operon transcriptional regulator